MALGEKQTSYLDDPDSHPDPKVRAALAFVAQMTVTPDALGPDAIEPLIEAGLDREAIEDVIYVCYLFNVYNRCADAFRFQMQDEVGWQNTAKHLLGRGYQ